MTPEQRREQAEREVREKLGWWIERKEGRVMQITRFGERFALNDEIAIYNLLVSQTIALAEAQKRIAELTKALRKIANPVLAMRVEAEAEGCRLSGSYAIALSEDHNYLKEIARAALKGE
jgi:purine-nucleoside phosphorylase